MEEKYMKKIFMRHMMDRNAMYLQQLLLESQL